MALSVALAQDAEVVANGEVPDLNAQNFRPTVDGRRTLWTDDAAMPVAGPMARLLLSYTDDPLVYLRGEDEVAIVSGVLQANVLAGMGVGPGRVGIDVPIYLFSDSDVVGGETGLGDLAIDGRVTIVGEREDAPVEGPLDIGLQGRIWLPTATVASSLGSPGVGYELAANVSKDIQQVLLAANLGTRGVPGEDLENATLSGGFVWRAGVGYAISDSGGVSGELTGQLDYAEPLSNNATVPMEAMLGGYGRPAADVVLRAGIGRGLTQGIGAPDLRVVVGIAYEPAGGPKDADGDGLVDKEDSCPDEPEDFDTYEDSDGCPDPDNDGDGILDASDQCPLIAEDLDGFEDADGCDDPLTQLTVRVISDSGMAIELAKAKVEGPNVDKRFNAGPLKLEVEPGTYVVSAQAGTYEANTATLEVSNGPPVVLEVVLAKQKHIMVEVTKERINLKDKVYFQTASAEIKPESFGLLDQAIQILKDYEEIRRLRIEGHTDSRGSDSYNLKLSGERAASVMAYFVSKGVAAERLTSEGFGETNPVDPAKTEAAYSKNRRVDFYIEEWKDAVR